MLKPYDKGRPFALEAAGLLSDYFSEKLHYGSVATRKTIESDEEVPLQVGFFRMLESNSGKMKVSEVLEELGSCFIPHPLALAGRLLERQTAGDENALVADSVWRFLFFVRARSACVSMLFEKAHSRSVFVRQDPEEIILGTIVVVCEANTLRESKVELREAHRR